MDYGNGLYTIGSGVRRLTVRETARVLQIEDDYVLDECALRARKQLSQSMIPGMVRALGVQIGKCLRRAINSVNPPPAPGEGVHGEVRGTPEELQWALHRLKVMAWQAGDAAAAASVRVQGLAHHATVEAATRW